MEIEKSELEYIEEWNNEAIQIKKIIDYDFLNQPIKFGKYKSEPIKLLKKDYIQWLITTNIFKEKTIHLINYLKLNKIRIITTEIKNDILLKEKYNIK